MRCRIPYKNGLYGNIRIKHSSSIEKAVSASKGDNPNTPPLDSGALVTSIVDELYKRMVGHARQDVGTQPPPSPPTNATQSSTDKDEGNVVKSARVPMGELEEIHKDKISIKIRVNPALFFIYDIFKSEAEKRGHAWDGDLGDFLYMAAKDALAFTEYTRL
ncbi:MAG: hypothetical protein ACPL4E_00830 [Thermoproteota archaeon]